MGTPAPRGAAGRCRCAPRCCAPACSPPTALPPNPSSLAHATPSPIGATTHATQNVVEYLHSAPPPPALVVNAPAPLAALAAAGDYARALVLLLIPVSWLHACFGVTAGWQLPPLQHFTMQAAMLAVLLRRAPRSKRAASGGSALLPARPHSPALPNHATLSALPPLPAPRACSLPTVCGEAPRQRPPHVGHL